MAKTSKKSVKKLSNFRSMLIHQRRETLKKESLQIEQKSLSLPIEFETTTKYQEVENILKKELSGVTQAEIALIQELKVETIKKLIYNGKKIYKTKDKLAVEKLIIEFLIMEVEENRELKNLKQEVSKIKQLGANTILQKARLLIYESLLALAAFKEEEIQLRKIRQAGEMLYNERGIKGMYDRLLWAFVPKNYETLINISWDGIGKWLA